MGLTEHLSVSVDDTRRLLHLFESEFTADISKIAHAEANRTMLRYGRTAVDRDCDLLPALRNVIDQELSR